jgi:ABC-type transporter MlaC component
MRLAHLLFLSGMVAGLTMASPSLANTTLNGTKSSAIEAVKSTINDLIQVLNDETLKQPEQAKERRHEIEKIIKHRVDYEEMAKRALGAPGPRFPIGTSTSSSTSSCNFFETHLWAASPNITTKR